MPQEVESPFTSRFSRKLNTASWKMKSGFELSHILCNILYELNSTNLATTGFWVILQTAGQVGATELENGVRRGGQRQGKR